MTEAPIPGHNCRFEPAYHTWDAIAGQSMARVAESVSDNWELFDLAFNGLTPVPKYWSSHDDHPATDPASAGVLEEELLDGSIADTWIDIRTGDIYPSPTSETPITVFKS